jgi:hypothetical protein
MLTTRGRPSEEASGEVGVDTGGDLSPNRSVFGALTGTEVAIRRLTEGSLENDKQRVEGHALEVVV